MVRSKRFLALILLTAVLAVACGNDSPTLAAGDDGTSGGEETAAANLDGSWILTAGMIDGTEMALLENYTVTMVIEGSEIGGRAACNSYGGSVNIDGGSFSVGALSSTAMGCEPAPMELEGTFLYGIGLVDTATRTGDTATLDGDGVSFSFALVPPVPTAELVGSTWVLDTILQGETASSTISTADPATLRLDADGTFVGGTGCRRVSGDYVVSGASLHFTSWGADGTCPEGLASQDNSVISVLEGDISVTIDGSRLTLSVPGDEGLSYRLEQ